MTINHVKLRAIVNRSIMALDSCGVDASPDPLFGHWKLDAIEQGEGARWWTSARLLLGLEEDEARGVGRYMRGENSVIATIATPSTLSGLHPNLLVGISAADVNKRVRELSQ